MLNLPKDMLHAAQARTMEFQNHASETLRIEHKLQTSIASIKQKLALNSKKDVVCVNCTRLHQQVFQKVQDAVSKDYTIRALQREIEDLKTQNRIITIKNNTQKVEFKANNEGEMHRPNRLDSKERKKTISQIYHIPDKLAEEETQLKQIQEKASLLKYKQKRERMLIKRLNSNTKRSTQSIPYAVIKLHESQASQSLKSYQPMSSSFHSQDCQPQVVQNLSGFSNVNQASKKVNSRSPEIEIKSEKSLNDPFQKVEGAVEELRRENQFFKKRCQTLQTDNNALKTALKQQELKYSSFTEKLQAELSRIKLELKQKTQQIYQLSNKIQKKVLEQQLLNKKIRNVSNELQRQILFSEELQQQVKIQSELVCEKADLNFKLGEDMQNLKYACKEEELRHLQTRRMLQAQEEESRQLREQNRQMQNLKQKLEEQLAILRFEIQKQRQLNREISEANSKKIKESFDQTLSELTRISESKETKIKLLEGELMNKETIIQELQRANNQFQIEKSRFLSQIQQKITQKNQLLIQKQIEIKAKNDKIQQLQHINKELMHEKQQIFADLQRNIQFLNQSKKLQEIYVNERNQAMFQKEKLEYKCQSHALQLQELAQQSLKHKEKEATIISLENSKKQAEGRVTLLQSELRQVKLSNDTDKDNYLKVQKDLALLRKQFNEKISEVNNLKGEQQTIIAAKDKELEQLITLNKNLQENISTLEKRIEQKEYEDDKRKEEKNEYQRKIKDVEKEFTVIRENLENKLEEKEQCIENLKREIEMTTNSYQNMMEMKQEQINELKIAAGKLGANKQEFVIEKEERQKQVASLRQLQATLKQELIEKQLLLKNLGIQVGNLKALFQTQRESHKESLKLKQSEFLRQRESLRLQNQSIRQKIVTLQSQISQQHSQKLKYLSDGQETHGKLMKNITLLETENKSKDQKIQELENLQKGLQEEYQGYRQQTSNQLKMKQEKITSYERKIQSLEQQQLLQRNNLKVKEIEFNSLQLSNDAIIKNKELQISELLVQKEERQKQVASLRQLQATLKQELIEKQLLLKNLGIQVGNLKALFQTQRESHKESLKLKQSEFLRQRESLRLQNQSIRQKIVTLQSQISQQHSQKLKYLSDGQETHGKLMKNITLLETENKSKDQKIQELENLQKGLQEEYQGYRQQTSNQLKMKQEKITSYERKIQSLEQQQLLQRNNLKVKEIEFNSLQLSNDAIIKNKELQISELLVQKEERQKQVASLRQLQATLKQELIEKQLLLKNLGIQVGNLKALFQTQRESHKESLKLKQSDFQIYKQSLKHQIQQMKQFVQTMQKFYTSQFSQFQKLQNQFILLTQTLKVKNQQIQHYQAEYFTLKLQCSQLQKLNQSFSHTITQSSQLSHQLQSLQHQNLLLKNSLTQKTIQCNRTLQYKLQLQSKMSQLQNSSQNKEIKQLLIQTALNEKDHEILQLKKQLQSKDQRIRELSSKLLNLLKDSSAPQKGDSQVLYTFVQSQKLIQQNKIEEELERCRAQFKELQPKIVKSEHNSSTHRLPLDLQTPIKEIDEQHELEQKPKSDKPNILQTKDIRDVLSHSQEDDFHYQLQQKKQASHLFGSRSQHGTYLGASIVSSTSNKSAVESQKEYASKMKNTKFLAKLNRGKKK